MLSRMTCLIIKNTNVMPIAAEGENGMWAGAILYGPDHKHHGMPLCETGPNYASREDAMTAMQNSIQSIKEDNSL